MYFSPKQTSKLEDSRDSRFAGVCLLTASASCTCTCTCTIEQVHEPSTVGGALRAWRVVQVAAGAMQSFAITVDGSLWAWGYEYYYYCYPVIITC